MGLYISHDAWQGGYSSFHLWRKCVAASYHIPLELMEGFWSKDSPAERLLVDLGDKLGGRYFKEKYYPLLPLSWEMVKAPEEIQELLYHSDCDGEIEPEIAGKIAVRLKEILPKIKSKYPRWNDAEVKDLTKRFIEGAEEAHAANEPLRFG